MFSVVCVPFPEFQVGRVAFAFDGTNYYIFIFHTIRSPKHCRRFVKGHFVCILQPKPRNSTFAVESGGVLDNVITCNFFQISKNAETVLHFSYVVV